ncbi:hypothetical protein Tco_0572846 [Tanacetum coccineum]
MSWVVRGCRRASEAREWSAHLMVWTYGLNVLCRLEMWMVNTSMSKELCVERTCERVSEHWCILWWLLTSGFYTALVMSRLWGSTERVVEDGSDGWIDSIGIATYTSSSLRQGGGRAHRDGARAQTRFWQKSDSRASEQSEARGVDRNRWVFDRDICIRLEITVEKMRCEQKVVVWGAGLESWRVVIRGGLYYVVFGESRWISIHQIGGGDLSDLLMSIQWGSVCNIHTRVYRSFEVLVAVAGVGVDMIIQRLADQEEARKKRQKRHDVPRTPPRSPPPQQPPPPHPAGASGALGTSRALRSSQLPPPPPPLCIGTSGSAQQQGNKAPSSSKTTTSASQSMAWTTSDTRYESAGVFGTHELSPNDSLMQDNSIPEEQVHLSDDEDSETDHQSKANSRKD